AVLTGGCDMNTTNPNAPDTKRAFGTPEGLTQLLAGAIQTWVGTRDNYFVLPLTAQADNYTASWNNAAIRFYSSVGSDCASRCGIGNSYDQGLALDENTDLTDPTAIAFSTRAQLRDAAIAKLNEAYAYAGALPWKTEGDWMGVGGGKVYTNVQIQQVIRTAQA